MYRDLGCISDQLFEVVLVKSNWTRRTNFCRIFYLAESKIENARALSLVFLNSVAMLQSLKSWSCIQTRSFFQYPRLRFLIVSDQQLKRVKHEWNSFRSGDCSDDFFSVQQISSLVLAALSKPNTVNDNRDYDSLSNFDKVMEEVIIVTSTNRAFRTIQHAFAAKEQTKKEL